VRTNLRWAEEAIGHVLDYKSRPPGSYAVYQELTPSPIWMMDRFADKLMVLGGTVGNNALRLLALNRTDMTRLVTQVAF
jgi:hypothetical protein